MDARAASSCSRSCSTRLPEQKEGGARENAQPCWQGSHHQVRKRWDNILPCLTTSNRKLCFEVFLHLSLSFIHWKFKVLFLYEVIHCSKTKVKKFSASNSLEKKWLLTKDPWFRLTTTFIGICVKDAWKLASFHGIINFIKKYPEKMMTITRLSGVLGWQIIYNASILTHPSSLSCFAPTNTFDVDCPTVSITIPHSSKFSY